MTNTFPFFVSVLFSLLLIGCFAAIIGIFVAGVLAVNSDVRTTDEDGDDNRGGDDPGPDPEPWPTPGSPDPIEQHEDELTLV